MSLRSRLLGSLILACATQIHPVAASAASLKKHIEKFEAHRDFHHVSKDGMEAFADIAKAQQILTSSGKTDAAIPFLYDAQKKLAAAAVASQKLTAVEAELHPAPQHPVSPGHKPLAAASTWIPVGGEFIVTDALAPEKKAAVEKANTQLKQGQTSEAQQTLQLVGQDLDFIVALAPLDQFNGALNRATVFTEGRQTNEAIAALNDAANTLVFVSENFIATQASPSVAKPTASKQ